MKLNDCTAKDTIIAEPRSADHLDPAVDLALRVDHPAMPSGPAYRIGTEDILVVVSNRAGLSALSPDQVRAIFSGGQSSWGKVDAAKSGKVQVWVYPPGDDVEAAFEGALLNGAAITSLARLANTPEEMAQAIASDGSAIGVIPGPWKTGDLTTVLAAATVPVLALTHGEPSGAVRQLLGCTAK